MSVVHVTLLVLLLIQTGHSQNQRFQQFNGWRNGGEQNSGRRNDINTEQVPRQRNTAQPLVQTVSRAQSFRQNSFGTSQRSPPPPRVETNRLQRQQPREPARVFRPGVSSLPRDVSGNVITPRIVDRARTSPETVRTSTTQGGGARERGSIPTNNVNTRRLTGRVQERNTADVPAADNAASRFGFDPSTFDRIAMTRRMERNSTAETPSFTRLRISDLTGTPAARGEGTRRTPPRPVTNTRTSGTQVAPRIEPEARSVGRSPSRERSSTIRTSPTARDSFQRNSRQSEQRRESVNRQRFADTRSGTPQQRRTRSDSIPAGQQTITDRRRDFQPPRPVPNVPNNVETEGSPDHIAYKVSAILQGNVDAIDEPPVRPVAGRIFRTAEREVVDPPARRQPIVRNERRGNALNNERFQGLSARDDSPPRLSNPQQDKVRDERMGGSFSSERSQRLRVRQDTLHRLPSPPQPIDRNERRDIALSSERSQGLRERQDPLSGLPSPARQLSGEPFQTTQRETTVSRNSQILGSSSDYEGHVSYKVRALLNGENVDLSIPPHIQESVPQPIDTNIRAADARRQVDDVVMPREVVQPAVSRTPIRSSRFPERSAFGSSSANRIVLEDNSRQPPSERSPDTATRSESPSQDARPGGVWADVLNAINEPVRPITARREPEPANTRDQSIFRAPETPSTSSVESSAPADVAVNWWDIDAPPINPRQTDSRVRATSESLQDSRRRSNRFGGRMGDRIVDEPILDRRTATFDSNTARDQRPFDRPSERMQLDRRADIDRATTRRERMGMLSIPSDLGNQAADRLPPMRRQESIDRNQPIGNADSRSAETSTGFDLERYLALLSTANSPSDTSGSPSGNRRRADESFTDRVPQGRVNIDSNRDRAFNTIRDRDQISERRSDLDTTIAERSRSSFDIRTDNRLDNSITPVAGRSRSSFDQRTNNRLDNTGLPVADRRIASFDLQTNNRLDNRGPSIAERRRSSFDLRTNNQLDNIDSRSIQSDPLSAERRLTNVRPTNTDRRSSNNQMQRANEFGGIGRTMERAEGIFPDPVRSRPTDNNERNRITSPVDRQTISRNSDTPEFDLAAFLEGLSSNDSQPTDASPSRSDQLSNRVERLVGSRTDQSANQQRSNPRNQLNNRSPTGMSRTVNEPNRPNGQTNGIQPEQQLSGRVSSAGQSGEGTSSESNFDLVSFLESLSNTPPPLSTPPPTPGRMSGNSIITNNAPMRPSSQDSARSTSNGFSRGADGISQQRQGSGGNGANRQVASRQVSDSAPSQAQPSGNSTSESQFDLTAFLESLDNTPSPLSTTPITPIRQSRITNNNNNNNNNIASVVRPDPVSQSSLRQELNNLAVGDVSIFSSNSGSNQAPQAAASTADTAILTLDTASRQDTGDSSFLTELFGSSNSILPMGDRMISDILSQSQSLNITRNALNTNPAPQANVQRRTTQNASPTASQTNNVSQRVVTSSPNTHSGSQNREIRIVLQLNPDGTVINSQREVIGGQVPGRQRGRSTVQPTTRPTTTLSTTRTTSQPTTTTSTTAAPTTLPSTTTPTTTTSTTTTQRPTTTSTNPTTTMSTPRTTNEVSDLRAQLNRQNSLLQELLQSVAARGKGGNTVDVQIGGSGRMGSMGPEKSSVPSLEDLKRQERLQILERQRQPVDRRDRLNIVTQLGDGAGAGAAAGAGAGAGDGGNVPYIIQGQQHQMSTEIRQTDVVNQMSDGNRGAQRLRSQGNNVGTNRAHQGGTGARGTQAQRQPAINIGRQERGGSRRMTVQQQPERSRQMSVGEQNGAEANSAIETFDSNRRSPGARGNSFQDDAHSQTLQSRNVMTSRFNSGQETRQLDSGVRNPSFDSRVRDGFIDPAVERQSEVSIRNQLRNHHQLQRDIRPQTDVGYDVISPTSQVPLQPSQLPTQVDLEPEIAALRDAFDASLFDRLAMTRTMAPHLRSRSFAGVGASRTVLASNSNQEEAVRSLNNNADGTVATGVKWLGSGRIRGQNPTRASLSRPIPRETIDAGTARKPIVNGNINDVRLAGVETQAVTRERLGEVDAVVNDLASLNDMETPMGSAQAYDVLAANVLGDLQSEDVKLAVGRLFEKVGRERAVDIMKKLARSSLDRVSQEQYQLPDPPTTPPTIPDRRQINTHRGEKDSQVFNSRFQNAIKVERVPPKTTTTEAPIVNTIRSVSIGLFGDSRPLINSLIRKSGSTRQDRNVDRMLSIPGEEMQLRALDIPTINGRFLPREREDPSPAPKHRFSGHIRDRKRRIMKKAKKDNHPTVIPSVKVGHIKENGRIPVSSETLWSSGMYHHVTSTRKPTTEQPSTTTSRMNYLKNELNRLMGLFNTIGV